MKGANTSMKFEQPIVEIQKFDLKDVISASGETAGEETEESTTKKSQPNTVVGEDGGVCAYNKTDNYNFDNCL
jgi:hypothetical protein